MCLCHPILSQQHPGLTTSSCQTSPHFLPFLAPIRLLADYAQLATFLSALLSILSAIMLGFLDDVFDIRWRHKLPIPMISCIPLLVVYFAGGGGTHIVVPTLLRARLKLPGLGAGATAAGGAALVDLGALYYVYITLLSIFCTNSINILAGINGVEVGQALVIALSLCANDAMYLDTRAGSPGSRSSVELVQRHLFSLYLLLPFAGTCIGLLWFNRFVAASAPLHLFSHSATASCTPTPRLTRSHLFPAFFSPAQIPFPRVCGRHVLLFCRASACLRGHLGPLQQDAPSLLSAADL